MTVQMAVCASIGLIGGLADLYIARSGVRWWWTPVGPVFLLMMAAYTAGEYAQ